MNRLITALVAAAALWTSACGGGGTAITPPPPSGNFGNASLNGTYAFVTSGEAITSGGTSATPLSRTGSFIANGSGGITGGVYDIVNAGGSSTTSSAPIAIMSGSSYTVNADGRGTLTFNVNSNGAPATLNFGIVLTSTKDGLMMDETASNTQASTGSGNFVLQNTAAFGTGVSGSYVFDFSGVDGSVAPESLVGQFSASAGVITSGIEDANDNFTLTSGSISGNFAPDSANSATSGRGIATIAGQTYAFYVVDSTRVRFISIGNGATVPPMLTGDAVSQAAVPAAPSGGFAFLVAGASANGGLIRVGRFDTCLQCANPGPTVTKLLMDVNNGGSENEFGPNALTMPSISYDSTTGRGQLSFQSSAANVYSFVFYLSSASDGVIQEVSGPSGTGTAVVVADGSILSQSGSPFTSSNITGPYAMNWSGLVTSSGSLGNTDEEDLLAQETIKSLSLSGTYDLFQFTGLTLGTDLGSTASINFNGGDGTGGDGKSPTMDVHLSNASPIHMVVYFVSPQLAFFANRDNNGAQRVVAGILKAQQ
ncbi:MAG TPA: hypothetical protein VJN92_15135 [Candidatus Acidoferrum sp.]|nr:hypothetical protein [Candidatus Acidoferrum sp.]